MKNIYKILLFSLSMLIIGVFFAIPRQNLAYADEKTVFMIEPSKIVSTSAETYVFDKSDSKLKLMQEDATLSSSYDVGEVLDMCAIDNQIFVLQEDSIILFDTETKTSNVAIDNISALQLSNISSFDDGENKVLLTFSKQTGNIFYYQFQTNEFIQYSIQIDSTENTLDLQFISFEDVVYLMKVTSSAIMCYHPVHFGSNLTLSTVTTLPVGEITEQIIGVSYSNQILGITYSAKTELFDVVENGGYISIEQKQTINHNFESNNFVAIDTSYADNKIYILSNQGHFTLSLTSYEIENNIQNPVCSLINLMVNQYEYYKVTKDSVIISTLGTNSSIDVPENSYVVKIAEVQINESGSLSGYKYVMFSNYYKELGDWKCENIFGYINDDGDNLEIVDTTEIDQVVKVYDKTIMYRYPSVQADQNNTTILTIGQNVPVTLVASLGSYSTGYSDTTDSAQFDYYLAKVGNNYGFISAKRVMDTNKRIILVMPNGKAIAGTYIYEEPVKNSTVIGILQKEQNVRIIGKRDSNGFIKIAFNDSYGNYFEGYVVASYVRSNSYTTLQIIGAVLVVINIIFLAILYSTKKKIIK